MKLKYNKIILKVKFKKENKIKSKFKTNYKFILIMKIIIKN